MKNIFIIFFCILLCSCGGLEETPEPPRRGDEPEGDPKPPKIDILEFTNWRDFLKNCKPEHNTPDNVTDMFLGAFPAVREHYFPSQIRSCVEKKLQDAHEQICNARDHWERVRKNPKSPSRKARAENELIKLEQLESKLNDKLYRLGEKARKQREKVKAKKEDDNWGRFWNLLGQDELEGWEIILDTESYSSCTIGTDDDDDDDD